MDVLAAWRRCQGLPFGRALFSRAVCWKAPYFGSIRPMFVSLESGSARVAMRKRRAVTNHIGTVHAIAMCNLAELAAGTMTEASIPRSMRWSRKMRRSKSWPMDSVLSKGLCGGLP